MPVLLVLSLVVGCSGTDGSDATTTTPAPVTTVEDTTTTSEAPTTTVPSTTSTAPTTTSVDDDIPYPDNTGTDWFKIVTELEAFSGWLFENPDSELVSEVSAPDSPNLESFGAAIAEYEANGWRDLPGGRAMVHIVEFADGSVDDGFVMLRVVTTYEGATTVDTNGTVVSEDPGRAPRVSSVALRGSPDQGWKIFDVSVVGPYEGEL